MKKKLNIHILLLLFPAVLSGQGFLVGFQSGVSSFGMTELKRFNEFVVGFSNLDAKPVHDYPSWFYYRANLAIDWKTFYIQGVYNTTSTGSRYSIYDYSGEYLYDTRIRAENPMVGFGVYLNKGPHLRFSLSNLVGRYDTELELQEYLTVSTINYYDETTDLAARNYCWEPALRCSWRKYFFQLSGYLGYLVQFEGEGLYPLENPDYHIKPGYAIKPVEPGWNGIRAGIEFSFFLSYKTIIYLWNENPE